MPVLTAARIHKLNRDPISDPHILMLEIEEEHSGLPLRLAVNNEDVVANGETYSRAFVEFSLPGQGDEPRPPQLTVSNVNRAPGRAVLLARGLIMVRMMVVDFSDPDTALIDTLDQFVLQSARVTAETVSGALVGAVDWRSPVPFFRTTRDLFPGVWAQRS